ncbi:class I SAM-dependent DNA methyltransferase [Mesorhizobium sp. C416B]|uniref:class I SAM-dependent DNA methyltransferase n=1 Tax=unclassified Mesorhizobium TaxID=325217 RepID=UPI0003CF4459|nr:MULTISPECIES: DNA methyltransferase [unclassified Mesorhizobium]ESX50219.1 DNA methyltransferase yeeA [Mesorhizobium sp. LSHC426A00]ESX57648.1 DNA methyltransferase yeeA [Mesorhizobium sp. LSHC424B00]ESX74783.1 DNA methyltransferase yeeA [Mesorhizobium sp. LSHC416B00]WJI62952.1 class I SAM-dependent DNA methyltransferase [Mesorhizobium sp. C416B]
MTPQTFIAKWQNSQLKERAAAQEHFLDLCHMLGEPTPADADPTGQDYGFEVGASKTTGGNGFADVFKRNHFGWEYKGTKANLDTAFAQLQRYAVALDNPPLLIVSDIGTSIRIHTNWTNSVSKTYEIAISDLGDAEKRGWLKSALSDPEALRPTKTRQELTEEVAGEFAQLARSLSDRGYIPERIAHFINRLVFCMFAEDVKLLPDMIFTRMLDRALEDPTEFEGFARVLFVAMKSGGHIGFEKVAWFNGGLFDDDLVFPLTKDEIKLVHRAASQYWGDIDPSILGTLFERGLDPDKRGQLGAHYTDREKIMMIINPVIVEPLSAEWERAKSAIFGLMTRAGQSKGAPATRYRNIAQGFLDRHLKRLAGYRVLDPACGSGNFLYLALRALKDLEHKAQVEAEAMGLPRAFPQIGPEVVRGIELNPYAAELARVSVWIGEIQWMLKNGFAASQNPVLKPLETIECRDALMTWVSDGGAEGGHWEEAEWPVADAIIGNPPFLGDRRMKPELGAPYVGQLRSIFSGTVRGGADLVCYWFAKAWNAAQVQSVKVGLVATNSIRGGANREVLKRILDGGQIFNAYSDEEWTVEGAAVRVSIVCFQSQAVHPVCLDGRFVNSIYSDLTGDDGGADLTKSLRLSENEGRAFQGIISYGPFQVTGSMARSFLLEPTNPDGSRNADVVRPWINGKDIAARDTDNWIIFFPSAIGAEQASLYAAPFEYLEKVVRPYREERNINNGWWTLWRSRGELFAAISGMKRYIVTVRHAKYRLFRFVSALVVPDAALIAISRDDYTSFGVLHSRHHELWALRMGSSLEDRPRYTPTTTFETFPFPAGLSPNLSADAYATAAHAITIAEAARRLDELRENWLNPPDLVRREPEVVPGYPDRILPVDEKAAEKLSTRTLTNLYNERPAWLQHAHKALDDAVAAAYGWPANLSDDDVLARLFALNQERASAQVDKAQTKQ